MEIIRNYLHLSGCGIYKEGVLYWVKTLSGLWIIDYRYTRKLSPVFTVDDFGNLVKTEINKAYGLSDRIQETRSDTHH